MEHNKLRTFHLFAGAGGGELADLLLGHIPVGACEIEPYPRSVLLQRMRDGILPVHPVWDDINTLDGKPWRGLVDVVCGGFPCQDISAAGKGAGIDGERSGLWGEMARIIREIRPRFAFVENSPMLTSRGLHRVLGDLAEMGYDAKWCVLGACDTGAPHKRDRIWILAELPEALRSECESRTGRRGVRESGEKLADSNGGRGDKDRCASELRASGAKQSSKDSGSTNEAEGGEVSQWWSIDPADISDPAMLHAQGFADRSGKVEPWGDNQREGASHENGPAKPLVGRVAHGVADRVDRLKAIGNGQVPQCAAMAWSILSA